jgi:hypothetical protein
MRLVATHTWGRTGFDGGTWHLGSEWRELMGPPQKTMGIKINAEDNFALAA